MDQWYEKYENTKVCHKKIALEAQEKVIGHVMLLQIFL